MSTTSADSPRRGASDLWGFLAFSHGWTWLFWGIVVAWGANVWESSIALAIFAIGGLGLPIGGVLMTWRVAGRSGLRDLGRRIVEPGRISGRWWIVVLFLYPAIKLAAGGLAVFLGTTEVPFDLAEAAELAVRPVDLLLTLAFIFLLGPLPEEVGWRGYLLDRLQVRYSALGASLLVGLAWFAWHGPLFFMTGYYARAGGAPDPLQFGVMLLLSAVLYTWVYNHTERSVLGAILFHFSGNVSGELLNAPPEVYAYETYLTIALVLAVLWRWGSERLG
ncbi:MAG TPA: type II CAAX endopeptidase family protein [Salinibacter sp.]|nr:type II CAAX endopeptidase family protein [Salinibacter sp.]